MQAIHVQPNDVVKPGVASHPLSPQVVVAPIQPLLAMTRQDSWNDNPPPPPLDTGSKASMQAAAVLAVFSILKLFLIVAPE